MEQEQKDIEEAVPVSLPPGRQFDLAGSILRERGGVEGAV